MSWPLAPVFLGALKRRRVATLFSFIAIVLGVALGMAVQAVHDAALGEFGRGVRALAGEADLQVSGPQGGFDESVYAQLNARAEVAQASPVVELDLKLAGQQANLHLLGVDVFTLGKVTPLLLPSPSPNQPRFAVLAEEAVFVSVGAATALGLQAGDSLSVQAGAMPVTLRVAGDLPGVGDSRLLAVMDIGAVQARFGRVGRLNRIDLRLAPGVSPQRAISQLTPLLPAGVSIAVPEVAEHEAARLSRAYRVNLTMLAAIALVTGGFLVFSAQALSVVRRRTEFAFLRAIGLSKRSLFGWLLAEGALIGFAGGVAGVALGYGLAWAALALLGGDLGAGYFAGLRPELVFRGDIALIYTVLGMLAGVAGAWLPARDAAAVAPAQALKASDESVLPGRRVHPLVGVALLLASVAACAIPPLDGLPLGGYMAVAGLLAAGVVWLPLWAVLMARVLANARSVPLQLAAARLAGAPGHAVVAAAGVLASVALAAAMAIMVTSFRESVDEWLTQVLPADLYLRSGRASSSAYLDPSAQARLVSVPGIAEIRFSRFDTVRLVSGHPPLTLIARPLEQDGRGLPLVEKAPPFSDLPPLWISEPVKDLLGWQVGQQVEVPLAGRNIPLRVAGVWRDYARQTGSLLLDLAAYRRFTGDAGANDAAVFLAPEADPRSVEAALLATAPSGSLEIARPGEIRDISLRIFDRSFAVTYLLEAVAVVIGLAGVAASFAALAAARRREFGMLRHLGVTRRQVAWMLAWEGALAAAVGVLSGLVTGGAISLVLIQVVNRQSFHWSMDVHVPWLSLGLFGTLLIVLGALAAVLAGRQAMREGAILAVREDW